MPLWKWRCNPQCVQSRMEDYDKHEDQSLQVVGSSVSLIILGSMKR